MKKKIPFSLDLPPNHVRINLYQFFLCFGSDVAARGRAGGGWLPTANFFCMLGLVFRVFFFASLPDYVLMVPFTCAIWCLISISYCGFLYLTLLVRFFIFF